MRHMMMILLFQLAGCLSLTAQGIEDLSFGTETTLEIMTWNIEHFPKNGQTTVNYVIDIIEALDVDILAIQEVDDIGSFNQLVDGLSSYNGYIESEWFAGLAYIFKPDIFLKYKNRFGGNIGIYMMDFWQSFEIDEPDDWTFTELLFKEYLSKYYETEGVI